ncbi:DoxX family protein [Nocardia sp. GAS34]|uniref:DoxX family protein n=1 Tax=unclassified Nocardia TaxID=2637762 RepID=UPI003D208C20
MRSALPKLRRLKSVTATAEQLRVPVGLMHTVGYLEALGSLGLAAGLAYAPFGIAAAAGLALLMIGASVAHIHGSLYTTAPPPLVIGAVAVALAIIDALRL